MSARTVQNDGTGTERRTFSRYDLLLAVLPIPLLFGLGGSTLAGVELAVGVGLGSLPTILLLGYALFVAAPTVDVDAVEHAGNHRRPTTVVSADD